MRNAMVVLAAASLITMVACQESCYRRDVSGKVANVGTRIARSGEGTQEKVAVRLNPYKADRTVESVGGGASGLDFDCISTRCAALAKDDCAQFVCRKLVRWWEPDVIECKMVKTIPCEEPSP